MASACAAASGALPGRGTGRAGAPTAGAAVTGAPAAMPATAPRTTVTAAASAARRPSEKRQANIIEPPGSRIPRRADQPGTVPSPIVDRQPLAERLAGNDRG